MLRLNFPEEPRVPTEEEYRKKAAAERDEPLRVLAHRKTKWKEQVATRPRHSPRRAFRSPSPPRESSGSIAFPLSSASSSPRDLTHRRPGRPHHRTPRRSPASIGRLGTLEPGKLGHLIAMTAPFTDEKAKVKYVLIDGLKFEIKPEDRSPDEVAGWRGRRAGCRR